MLGRRAKPAPLPPARLAALAGLWAGAVLLGLGCFLVFSAAVPKIGLPAHIAIGTLPLAACLWVQAVIFPKPRPPSPPPRSLAIVPAPVRAAPLPDAPAPLVARLLLDAASRPETEAERREIAARRAHDPVFAAAAAGLDETATRALLASRRHAVLAADLAATARRIAAARAVQAPLPPDARRDQIHAALLATAPAAAAALLEAMRAAPDLDPARVAANLMRGQPSAEPLPGAQAPLDEARLAAALEALSRLGPVTAQPNPDGSITLRPAALPRVQDLPALGGSGVLLAPPG
ncbi:hypothetical protein G3576_24275 [Roseomonas stagni]|uniref:Uncharacterized protein n=1 Tax=Falsiroseomonas algicola TaxID=2716930 RepID=A0A6M1LSZ9_9PROT|nr:hypothetical protein [Falsiroseomonas algicola]NGM23152.1 hypothetical protein [Falsiroseomonas algicola]